MFHAEWSADQAVRGSQVPWLFYQSLLKHLYLINEPKTFGIMQRGDAKKLQEYICIFYC